MHSQLSARSSIAVVVLAVSLFLFTCFAFAAPTYTAIDFPGSNSTTATGINNGNQIVGYYNDTKTGLPNGFLLTGTVFTTISVPGSLYTQPFAINDSGTIVGSYTTSDSHTHGFLYDGQSFTTLDNPGAIITEAQGINNAGTVVGWSLDASALTSSFEWAAGVFTPFNLPGADTTVAHGIDNNGDIVGSFIAGGSTAKGFLLTVSGTQRLIYVPDSDQTVVSAVNDFHMTVGQMQAPHFGRTLGFGFTTTYVRIIPTGTGSFTSANGVNNAGIIVGSYLDTSGLPHGYLRTP